MVALPVVPATAGDLTINVRSSTPVVTSNANSGPGNVFITTNGILEVTTPVPAAITIDSNHNVTNEGILSHSVISDAVAVKLIGGGANAGITNSSAMGAGGDGGTNNVGILSDATGFQGD